MAQDDAWVLRRLETVVNNLQRMRDEYPDITRHYPNWSNQRRVTIDMIGQLQERLDTVYKNARLATGAGSFVSLAGAVSTIVGTVLSFRGSPSATSWFGAGSALKTTGDIAVPVATLLEAGISKYFMGDLQAIVERDQTASQPMLNWLQYSANMDEAMQELFGCSIFSDIWNDVLLACTESVRLMESGREEARHISSVLRRRLKGKIPENVLEEIINSCSRIVRQCLCSAGRGALRTLIRVCDIVKSEPVQVCIMSAKLYSHVNGLANVGECSKNTSVHRLTSEQCTRQAMTTQCLSEALVILLDILIIINSKDGFFYGKSEHSKRLEVIKVELNSELTRMENFIICFENRA